MQKGCGIYHNNVRFTVYLRYTRQRVEEIDGYMCESLDFVALINAYTDTLAKLRQRGIQGEKIVGE